MGRERLREVGRMIRAAATTGATRYVNGVTTAAPANGRISVDIGDQVIPATIPGSFRAALAADQNVRLAVQGTVYVVDSVLSPLPTPAVSSVPSDADTSGASDSTVSSGAYDWTDGTQMGTYARDIAASTRGIAGNLNTLRSVVLSIRDTLNDLVSTVNDLKTAVAEIRAALKDQGHIT